MKQGSTFVLIVNLNVDLSRINSVIFTLKNKDVTLTKENWSYNDGKFEIPFTQEETVSLEGRTRIEGQVNFLDGNVAKTQIKDIYIKETLATKIIDGNIATQEGREVELLVEEDVIYVGGGGGTKDYNHLENKPKINNVELVGDKTLEQLGIKIPIKTSELENDSGFITEDDLPSIPSVPTKTSELQNDSNFTTQEYVDNLVGDVQTILTELHTYAESLVGGEA